MRALFLFPLLFIIFLSTVNSIYAQTWIQSSDDKQILYVGGEENGTWELSEFTIQPGKLQERTGYRTFKNEQSYNHYIQRLISEPQLSELTRPSTSWVNTEVPGKFLWEAQNQWNEQWEKQFSDWVETEFDENYFYNYGIATDCADAAIALRWIFARLHSLPMGSTLAGSEVLITHESMKKQWLNLPTDIEWHQDQRFLAALNFVIDNTYTHTLIVDSYPIKIDTLSLRTGAYRLNLFGETGHTSLLGRFDYSGKSAIPIYTFNSSVPKVVRRLFVEPYLLDGQGLEKEGGWLRHRWLVKNITSDKWQLLSKEDHPHFSKEQYSDELKNGSFSLNIYQKLIPGFSPSSVYEVAIDDYHNYLERRISVVQEGYEACQKLDCSPGTSYWEDWSTPARDKKIQEKYEFIEYLSNLYNEFIDPKVWLDKQNKTWLEIEGVKVSLKELTFIWKHKLFSSDPRVHPNRRWGLNVKSVRENISEQLSDLILEREALVKGGEQSICHKSGCESSSNEFLKWQSYELDEKFRTLAAGYINYCSFLRQVKDCIHKLKWDKSIFINDQKIQLEDFIKNIPWFVADPNAESKYRWGMEREKISGWHHLPYTLRNPFPAISNNSLMNVDFEELYDFEKQVFIKKPSDCELLHWKYSEEYLCLGWPERSQEQKLSVHVYSSGYGWSTQSFEALITNDRKILMLPHNYFAIMDEPQKKVYLFSYKKGQISLDKTYEGYLDLNDPLMYTESMVIYQGNDQLKSLILTDLNSFSEYSLEGIDGYFIELLSRRGKDIVITTYKDNQYTNYHLDKKSMKLLRLEYNDFFIQKILPDFNMTILTDGHILSGIAQLYMGLPPGPLKRVSEISEKLKSVKRYDNFLYLITEGDQLHKYEQGVMKKFKTNIRYNGLFATNQWIQLRTEKLNYNIVTDFEQNQLIQAPLGGDIGVCHLSSNNHFDLCQSAESEYFWVYYNRQTSDLPTGEIRINKWANLYSFQDLDLKNPIMSRSMNETFFPIFDRNIYLDPQKGTVIRWAHDAYIWKE